SEPRSHAGMMRSQPAVVNDAAVVLPDAADRTRKSLMRQDVATVQGPARTLLLNTGGMQPIIERHRSPNGALPFFTILFHPRSGVNLLAMPSNPYLTDDEWATLAPLVPSNRHPRAVDDRCVVLGLFLATARNVSLERIALELGLCGATLRTRRARWS